jgi:hypothetical protein
VRVAEAAPVLVEATLTIHAFRRQSNPEQTGRGGISHRANTLQVRLRARTIARRSRRVAHSHYVFES